MNEIGYYSRFIIGLLAVFATGALIALWHTRLENAGPRAKIVALALYFATLWTLVRLLVAMSRAE